MTDLRSLQADVISLEMEAKRLRDTLDPAGVKAEAINLRVLPAIARLYTELLAAGGVFDE